jgi:hypothetical protein
MKLMGVDVGFSKKRAATGIACLDGNELLLWRAKTSWEDRKARIPEGFRPSVIALDGPLLPKGANEHVRRRCEFVFIRDLFSKRCKPGLSHCGFGFNLRRAAADACAQFSQVLDDSKIIVRDAFVRGDGPIVEAFPNAFLGVLLPEEVFLSTPKLKPHTKFDWLYKSAVGNDRLVSMLSNKLDLPEEVWNRLKAETNHELQAAFVCLLTAAFAAQGTASSIGNAKGGWFWLPPKCLWQPWAREGLHRAEANCVTI